jgi:hypothetical protein
MEGKIDRNSSDSVCFAKEFGNSKIVDPKFKNLQQEYLIKTHVLGRYRSKIGGDRQGWLTWLHSLCLG